MNETKYTRADLLEILRAYKRQIERSGKDFPTVVLSDIEKSIDHVLTEAST